jgi:hypothetical protein
MLYNMSLLIVALLFGLAFVLMDSGLSFIAFMVFMVAVLSLITNRTNSAQISGNPQVHAPRQRPVIVTSSGGQIPSLIKVVTKKPWAGTDLWEDFTIYMGIVLQWPFRLLSRIITGKAGKFAKDH